MSWISRLIESIRFWKGHAKHKDESAGSVDRYVKWLEKHNMPTADTGRLMWERHCKQMGMPAPDYGVIHLGPSSLEETRPKIAPLLRCSQRQKGKLGGERALGR